MKNFKLKIIIAYSLLLCSCESSNFSWDVYDSSITNILSQNTEFDDIVITSDFIYLLGYSRLSKDIVRSKALIYKSNFEGKNWKINLSKNGIFSNPTITKNYMYLLKETFTENSYANIESSLCRFDRINNNKFEVIKELKGTVRKIHFVNDSIGSVILQTSNKLNSSIILNTVDNGQNWDTISIKKNIIKEIFHNKKVYLLENRYDSLKKKRVNNNIEVIDIDTRKKGNINLDSNVIDFFISDEEKILALVEGNRIISIDLRKNNDVNIVFSFNNKDNLFPKKVYGYNNFFAIIFGELNSVGTVNHLYLSFDKGRTFKKERLPIDNYLGAINFYKDQKIVIYSGLGRISICNLVPPDGADL